MMETYQKRSNFCDSSILIHFHLTISECEHDEFSCDDFRCILKSQVCDGTFQIYVDFQKISFNDF